MRLFLIVLGTFSLLAKGSDLFAASGEVNGKKKKNVFCNKQYWGLLYPRSIQKLHDLSKIVLQGGRREDHEAIECFVGTNPNILLCTHESFKTFMTSNRTLMRGQKR